jgi:hypothetical protein
LTAIFSRTDLIKKKRPNAYRQTKLFGRQWRPGDRKCCALLLADGKRHADSSLLAGNLKGQIVGK